MSKDRDMDRYPASCICNLLLYRTQEEHRVRNRKGLTSTYLVSSLPKIRGRSVIRTWTIRISVLTRMKHMLADHVPLDRHRGLCMTTATNEPPSHRTPHCTYASASPFQPIVFPLRLLNGGPREMVPLENTPKAGPKPAMGTTNIHRVGTTCQEEGWN